MFCCPGSATGQAMSHAYFYKSLAFSQFCFQNSSTHTFARCRLSLIPYGLFRSRLFSTEERVRLLHAKALHSPNSVFKIEFRKHVLDRRTFAVSPSVLFLCTLCLQHNWAEVSHRDASQWACNGLESRPVTAVDIFGPTLTTLWLRFLPVLLMKQHHFMHQLRDALSEAPMQG